MPPPEGDMTRRFATEGCLEFASEEDEPDTLLNRMLAMRLFRDCSEQHLEGVIDQSKHQKLKPGQEVLLQDGGPLVVVESGAVSVRVGGPESPETVFGPGEAFNFVGMLMLAAEVEPFRPIFRGKGNRTEAEELPERNFGGAYETHYPGSVPFIFQESRRRQRLTKARSSLVKGSVSQEDQVCFYNLCPNAASRASPPPLNGWVPLTLRGAPPGVVPLSGGEEEECAEGGATVLLIPYSLLHRVGNALGNKSEEGLKMRASLAQLQQNSRELCDIWRTLISRCSQVFFGVPPEVMWRIAEMCTLEVAPAGEVIAMEGRGGDAAEGLILIDEGVAVVEKRIGEGGRVGNVEIGTLGPGALIGDPCLLGAGIPRPATVRAKSEVQYLSVPASCLRVVFKFFPGVMEGLEPYAKEVGSFLQVRLPTRTAAFSSISLLAGCSPALINEVAGQSERQLYHCGQVVMDPAESQRLLFVLEYGSCGMESSSAGCQGEISAGSCFGDCDVLGKLAGSNHLVRVRTPIAVLSVTRSQILKDALRRHCGPEEKWPFAGRKDPLPCDRDLIRLAAGIELFRGCSPEFVRDILDGALYRGYLPGQTLCVEAAQFSHDDAHMFVLRGGQTATGGDSPLAEQGGAGGSGGSFGELAMLGAEHKRPSTIRALTACFTLEVPRASFIAAIARHPGEKHHFERFAVQVIQEGGSAGDETVQWPFLKGAPARMLYLLNLYAGLKAMRAAEVIAQAREGEVLSSSVLIAHGEAVVLDSEGNEVRTLQQGECYNERAILGVPPDQQRVGESIVARAHCEAQVLTDELWKRVSSEFPEEQEPIRQHVIRHMASQAVVLQDLADSPPSLLRRAGLLRPASEQMLTALAQHLEPRLVLPMQDIMSFGDAANHLLILVDGRARCECSCGTFEYAAGKVFNEAVLLGVVHYNTRTVSAHTLCVLQALDRAHFQDQSSWTQNDLQIMEPLLEEVRECADLDLEACLPSTRLGKMAGFDSAAHDFLVQVCDNADDRFFVPGEVIMQHGEKCEPGRTPFYALFRGDLVLENDLGVHLGHVKPGETFGESGALGLSDMRTVTVRASMSGCVHVLRIEGVPFTTGIRMFPHECRALEAIIDARWGNTAEQAGIRQKWIRNKVVPALRAHWMFADTSLEFVGEVAVGLSGSDFGAGDVIAEAGSAADSMLILLEGEADVETEGGVKLGSLKAGASIGEVALMGIFPMRLATLRATTACSVLPVTEKALRRALAELGMQGGNAFTELTAHRSWQVQKGLPLTALPMRLSKDNICARSIALQARRIHLAPNQIWECLPASHPAGQHFGILASGRANVELCNEEEPPKRLRVKTLNPGSLIVEDVAAEYGMWVRALSVCEGYRVRMVDFKTATAKSPTAADEWYPHFRLIQVEAEENLRSRGDNVRGQMVNSFEHPNSDGIRLWKSRREKAMARAPKQVLPPLVHADSQQELRPRPLKPLTRELSGSALPKLPGI